MTAFFSLACGQSALADSNRAGAYFALTGGVNGLGDQNVEATIDGLSGEGNASFSASYFTAVSFGYRFANNWAIEEEAAFRRVTLDSVDLSPIGQFSDGAVENTQLSVRVLYHLPVRSSPSLEGYLGVGVAWLAELDLDLQTRTGEQPFENDRFGVEFHAGLRYHGWRHAFAGVGLRYLTVADTTLPDPSNAGDVIRTGYDPFSATIEFGWRF